MTEHDAHELAQRLNTKHADQPTIHYEAVADTGHNYAKPGRPSHAARHGGWYVRRTKIRPAQH